MTFVSLVFATFVAFVAFWVDLAFVLVGRSRASEYTGGAFSGHIGPAFWMALGGLIALMLALCATGCGMFGKYKDKRNRRSSFDREEKLAGAGSRKPYVSLPSRMRGQSLTWHSWQRKAAPVAAAPMQQNTYPGVTPAHNVTVHPIDPATGTYAATVVPNNQQRY